MQYFYETKKKIFAILNCRRRRSVDDRIIAMPLDTQELRIYRESKAKGKPDSAIFRTLFPPRIEDVGNLAAEEISVRLGSLNKKQLVHLITEELKVNLPSLTKMNIPDLRKMLLKLRRGGS